MGILGYSLCIFLHGEKNKQNSLCLKDSGKKPLNHALFDSCIKLVANNVNLIHCNVS